MTKSSSVPNVPKPVPKDDKPPPSPGTGTPIHKPRLPPSSGKSGAEKG